MLKFNSKRNINLIILMILLLIPIFISGIWYFYIYQSHERNAKYPIVETAVVAEHPLEQTLSAIGTLQANQSVIIRPEVSGRVTEILFQEGQTIIDHQPLFILENTIETANVRESKADFLLRQLEFQRAETLLSKGAGSVTEKDNAFAKLEMAAANLEKAEANLKKMHISAPFAGVIGLRKVNVGDFITPGQALVNLVNSNVLRIDFSLPEIYLDKIKIGQKLQLSSDAFPHQGFEGEIYAIDPQINPVGHNILLKGLIENQNNILYPGLFVKITILLDPAKTGLLIPVEALMPQEKKQYVFKVDTNNRVTKTEVVVGERTQNQVEILNGLKAGDIVITAGQAKVQEGEKVQGKLKGTLQ